MPLLKPRPNTKQMKTDSKQHRPINSRFWSFQLSIHGRHS
uniref:Uncharacterized protein n=1 Tax=Rhizophora mucronata TaxID=61149 RepID=A0A2P2NPK3_RHIMU